MTGPITLKVNADTILDETNPTAVYGGSGMLTMRHTTGNHRYALLHVAIPGLPGAIVQSAVLHVYIRSAAPGQPDYYSGSDQIIVNLLTASFTEQDTWNTYFAKLPVLPGPDQVTQAVGSPHGDGTEIKIDVTALLADAAASGNNFGFLLSTNVDANRRLYASDSATVANRPVLRINYAQAPPGPTNLLPALGASAQRPRLSWTSADQTAYRVQVDRASTFDSTAGSPDYDSGWRSSTTQGADLNVLAAPAYSNGLPSNGDLRYWRVQIQNSVGAGSAWATSSWTRYAYGTVGISSPAVDGDPVDATSPSVGWVIANAVEGRFELLELVSGYDSGEIDGNGLTTDSAQIPRGYVRTQGTTYTAVVRVWDTFPRDAAGEAGYITASRSFVYTPSGATAAVPTLTAVVDEEAVVLTWTRSAEPDSFIVFANGKDSIQLDPATVFVSGTTYSYRYLRAMPDVSTTYEVVAHNDSTGNSASNATAAATITPLGIWLVDEGTGVEVKFEGQSSMDMKVVEDGAIFLPLGQRSPIRVVDVIRGYNGTIAGVVSDATTITDLGTIKAVPPGEGTIRLIYGSFNFPIDLGEITVSELPFVEEGRMYSWQAEFWQTGEPWVVTQ